MKKAFALCLLAVLASAEAGPATKYLSNEPATLLDVGMIRLHAFTADFKNRVGLYWTNDEGVRLYQADVHASFEPDDDKFIVSISAMNSEPSDAQMAEGCRNAMRQMNIWLLKSLPGLFLHTGYDDPSVPENFYSNLVEMFEIRCYFSSGRDSAEGRFWAHRKLGDSGDEMTVGKWKMRN